MMASGVRLRASGLIVILLSASAFAQTASDAPDLAMYARIRSEGLSRSRVMEYATQLLDGIGARLSGSPNLDRAVSWSIDRLREAGLTNVRQDRWGEFGMGWRRRNVWATLVEPDTAPLLGDAAPWSPPTPGPVTGELVYVSGFTTEQGFAPLRGTLRDKIVVLGRAPSMPAVVPIERPLFDRFSDAQLAELARDVPAARPANAQLEQAFANAAFFERVSRFFADEGVLAVLEPTGNNPRGGYAGGIVVSDWNYSLGQYAHRKERMMRVPVVVLPVESWTRLARLLERRERVRATVNVDAEFTADRVDGFNVFAEIAGVDPVRGREVVMVGAHLDSWHAGTGATDDGAGVLIAMEAMRILQAVGARPRRTIRLALWTGEEQGALGSLAWVTRELATIPRVDTPAHRLIPEAMRSPSGAAVPKAAHALVSAMYDLDQGGGRIRGVRVGRDAALIPIFQRWIEPLKDLGVAVVSPRGGCASDCLPFEQAGIPSPIFVQDPLDYTTRTLHSSSDTFDHLIPDDLKQAAVVVAAFLYSTAQRDELLPRAR
jgi:acetylornithine deacetylase/succinyl-diaminopimelate desuccinylase-like protein